MDKINVCYDEYNNIKCGTSYDDWCETCPNYKYKKERLLMAKLIDTGDRKIFDSGAHREIIDGKGRCDLLPIDIVSDIYSYQKFAKSVPGDGFVTSILDGITKFIETRDPIHIYQIIHEFCEVEYKGSLSTMFIEVAIHYEDGARKYAENNWKHGLPLHSYIDSGLRHYFKWLRNDKDEPHDRAFIWNMMCLLWTFKHKPEFNDVTIKIDICNMDNTEVNKIIANAGINKKYQVE